MSFIENGSVFSYLLNNEPLLQDRMIIQAFK
jgi:hypothetical protein